MENHLRVAPRSQTQNENRSNPPADRKALLLAALMVAGMLWPGMGLAQPVPSATLNVPAEIGIGEGFSFTATLSNTSGTSTDVGYGPFIDLMLPLNGADGNAGTAVPDGIDFVNATYLGSVLTAVELVFPDDDGAGPGTTGCVDHPYALDMSYLPVQVCGTAGDKLVVLQLPFGSLVTSQPAIDVTVNASLSNLADLGTALTIRSRGGFQFGANPLDDPCCDPSILDPPSTDSSTWPGSTTTPTLISLSKTYSGPESETATGPNLPRQYTIAVDIANGQTVTNLDITDVLPSNVAFLSVDSVVPAGVVTDTPTIGAAANAPNNDLTVTFGSVTGTAAANDVTVTFSYFVPQFDANGSPVNPPTTGDDTSAPDNASALGDWTPIDGRDAGATDNASAGVPGPEHTLFPKSIAIQKAVGIAGDVGAAGPSPGDTLEYTLEFQISDFFAFDGVEITDDFSDGQRFDATFTPTLSLTENGSTTSGNINGANYTVLLNSPGDGSTTLTFRISDELVTRSLDADILGGCVPAGGTGSGDPDCSTFNGGATVATVVFRTVIQENFSDTYPSGDQSVDQGDTLDDTVVIDGDLLDVTDLSGHGTSEDDDSGASVNIAFGTLLKDIYAINGSTSLPVPLEIYPGDDVTFRLRYSLPSSDFENLSLTDYLPLPVFDATTVTTFIDTVDATSPAAGNAKFGPTDTFRAIGGVANGIPAISTDSDANSLIFTYGTFDDPASTPTQIDLLFTVTVETDPFADGLFLTNQVRAEEGTTNAGNQTLDAIQQVTLREPYLVVTKGATWSNNPAGVFTPPVPTPSLPIGSDDVNATPFDSDIADVDAGDLIEFTITVENTGGSGAFDIVVHDTIPAGFAVPSAAPGMNLTVVKGDGSAITWTGLGGGTPANDDDLFFNGIELVDSAGVPVCQKAHPSDGSNIALVSYRLEVVNAEAIPEVIIANLGGVTQYSGSDGDGTTNNHVEDPPLYQDETEVTVASPTISKVITATSEPHTAGSEVAIGELVTYTVTIRIPEGVSPSSTLVDTLDSGLVIQSLDSITASPGLSTSHALGFPGVLADAVVGGGGTTVTFPFDDVTNTNTNNAVDETIVVVYTVRVDAATASDGDSLNNAVVWTWSIGNVATAAPNVDVVEPDLQITKGISATNGNGTLNGSAGPPEDRDLEDADGGDGLTFTLTVEHTAASSTDAFDLEITDVLPAWLNWVGNVTPVTGPAPAVDISGLPTVRFTWPTLTEAQATYVFSFDVVVAPTAEPNQTITNTADLRWDSLPGETGERDYGPVSDSATIDILNVALDKNIIATSEAHTGFDGSRERLAIGEIVRYRLEVELPEGTATNIQLRDRLPSDLLFIDDNTAMVALISDGAGITSSGTLALDPVAIGCDGVGANPNLVFTGNETNMATITPECPLPDLNITRDLDLVDEGSDDNYGSGTDPYFKLATLVNADSDANIEYVVVEFNALMMNVATANPASSRGNRFRVYVDNTNIAESGYTYVRVIEPQITDVAKGAVPVTGDAGDPVAFTVTYSNANGVNNTTAFEVRLVDDLSTLDLVNLRNITVTLGGGAAGITDNSAGNVLDVTIATVPAGGTVQIDYLADIANTANPAEVITNTANLLYTSLPGPTGTGPNPTGSLTPGASGADNGERDGSDGEGVAPDDYADSDSASVTIDSVSLTKVVTATSEASTGSGQHAPAIDDLTIGETATFQITAVIPEGTTTQVVITDTLPFTAGVMEVVSAATVRVGLGAPPADNLTAVNDPPLVTISDTQLADGINDTVVFDFGQVTNAPDGAVTAADEIVVEVVGRLVDEAANVDSDQLLNSALVQFGPGLNQSATANVDVVEPFLVIDKSGSTNSGDAGDTITFTVDIRHTGTSTADAFDLVITDVIPANMTYVPASLTDTGALAADSLTEAAGTITASWASFPLGSIGTFTFQVTLDNTVVPNTTITNTADAEWDTLPADADPNERDHTDSDNHPVLITEPGIVKTVFATTEPSTGTAINGPEDDLTIGEQVTYRFVFAFSEGTSPSIIARDQLPVGTAVLSVVSSQIVRIGANLSGTPPLPAVGSPGVASNTNADAYNDRVEWNLGDVLNTPDGLVDANDEIEFEVVAVVVDEALNQGGLDDLVNTATLFYGASSVSDTALVDIVEPELQITKMVTNPPGGFADAGDTVTMQLLIEHSGSTADAFTLEIDDTLPDPGLSWINDGTVSSTCPGGVTVDSGADPLIEFSVASLTLAGGSCTITYDVSVDILVNPGVTYQNTAVLDWDSQPVYTAGETRRQTDSDPADITINAPALVKVATTTSLADTGLPYYNAGDFDLAIGETVTYQVTAAFPEGTTVNSVVTDQVQGDVAGVIELIGASVVSLGGNLVTTLPGTPVFADNLLADTLNDTVTLDFGTVTNSPDGVSDANDRIVINVVGRVVDVAANAAGDSLQNLGRLTYSTGGPVDDTADVDVVEPNMAITKAMGPVVNGVVTMTVTLTNNGNAPAYDIEIEDLLASATWNTSTITPLVIPAGFTFAAVGAPGDATVTIASDGGSSPPANSIEPTEAVGFVFQVTLADPANPPASVVNTATNTVTTTLPGADPDERDEPDVADTDTLGLPIIELDKSAALAPGGDLDGSGTASPGDILRYTITITNSGTGAASNLVVTDTPDGNTTLVVGSVTAAGGGVVTVGNTAGDTTIQVDYATFLASSSAQVTYDVQVANPVVSGLSELVNWATVSCDQQPDEPSNDPSTPADDDPTRVPLDAAPDLQVFKDDGGITTVPGGNVAYTLAYDNVGNQAATGVVITETVPAGSNFNAAGSSGGWVCVPAGGPASATCTNSIGTLTVGGGSTLTFAVTVDDPLGAGVEQLDNTASIADDGSNGPDPNPDDTSDTDDTPITAVPDLQITKDDGGITTTPGSTVSYTLTYTNVGNQEAGGVTITDTVPANTTFNSGASTPGWACVPDNSAGSTCTLDVGDVAPSGTATPVFAVTVDNPAPGGVTEIANSSTIADDGTSGTDPTPGDNSSSDTTPVGATPDLQIAKDDGGVSVTPGGTVSYTLTYTNAGDQDATGVTITDTVPADAVFNPGASTGGWACAPDNNPGSTCTISIGSVSGGGGTGNVIFAVTVDDPLAAGVTQISNTTDIADDGTNGTDPNPADNTDSDTTPVTTNPSLEATKSDALTVDADASGDVTAGDTLTYSVVITNDGDVEVLNVVFNDAPDANTSLVVGSVTTTLGTPTSGNTAGDTTVAVNVGNIFAGASLTITFDVTVNSPLPGGVTMVANQGVASGDTVPGEVTDDPETGQIDDPTITPIGSQPLVDALKSDALAIDADLSGGVSAGDTLEYTVTVSNNGGADATGVVFTDTPGTATSLVVGSVTTTLGTIDIGNTAGNSTVQVTIGTLAQGAAATITFRVLLDDPLPVGLTEVSNQGLVASDGAPDEPTDDPDTAEDDDPTDTPIQGLPALDAVKTDTLLVDSDGDGAAGLGDTLRYVVTIINGGDGPATGVVFTDTPDSHTDLDVGSVATSQGTVTTGNSGGDTTVAVDVGSIAGGDDVTITFDVVISTPPPAGVDRVANQGVVSSDAAPDEPTDDPDTPDDDDPTTTPLGGGPDLVITKDDGVTELDPPVDTTYALVVTNAGTRGASGVLISDTIPAETVFVSASDGGAETTPGSGIVEWPLFTLEVGEQVTVNLTVHAPAQPPGNTVITNTATVTDDGSNGDDLTPGDNTDTDTDTMQLYIDIDAFKTVSPPTIGDSYQNGDEITWTITVTNSGNTTAAGMVLTDQVPDFTTYVLQSTTLDGAALTDAGDGDAGSYDSATDTITVALPSMPAAGSAEVIFSTTINIPPQSGSFPIENQGTIDTIDGTIITDDPDTGEPDDPTGIMVVQGNIPTTAPVGRVLLMLLLATAGFLVLRRR